VIGVDNAPEVTDASADQVTEPARHDAVSGRSAVMLVVGVALVVYALDLISKLIVVHTLQNRAPITVIPSVLDLELIRNPGAAFGIAGGATILFSVVAVGVVVVILRTARNLHSAGWAVVLGLLLGGAIGNLSDRIFRAPSVFRGHVVDWVHLHHWPVFNLADSAIVVGVLLAILLSFTGHPFDASPQQHEQTS
jgi:signal peptidase II